MNIIEKMIIYSKDSDMNFETFESIIADFFDLQNRVIPLNKQEKKWIKKNLTIKQQIKILGLTIKSFNKQQF